MHECVHATMWESEKEKRREEERQAGEGESGKQTESAHERGIYYIHTHTPCVCACVFLCVFVCVPGLGCEVSSEGATWHVTPRAPHSLPAAAAAGSSAEVCVCVCVCVCVQVFFSL